MSQSTTKSESLFNVSGLVAVVTGGGSGIGTLIAQGLADNGAIVYILGRRLDRLQEAAAAAGNIHPVQADVTSKEDLARAAKQIEQAQGFVNVVIANSGYSGPSLQGLQPNASLAELQNHLWSWDSAQLTNVFEVNNIGVLNTITAFLLLLEAGNKAKNVTQKSQVIATGSAGAYNRVPVGGYAYGSSKAGLIHMMKSFATGLVPYNIRANVIAPGFYPSEMTEHLVKVNDEKGWPKSVVPEQRAGDAQDMTGAVLFLVSRAGAYINGNVLLSDGGRLGVVPSSY